MSTTTSPFGETTSRQLPDGQRVHKHQLIVDRDSGDEFMLTRIDAESLSLVEVTPPRKTDDGIEKMEFGSTYILSVVDFIQNAEPQFATNGEPVWAY